VEVRNMAMVRLSLLSSDKLARGGDLGKREFDLIVFLFDHFVKRPPFIWSEVLVLLLVLVLAIEALATVALLLIVSHCLLMRVLADVEVKAFDEGMVNAATLTLTVTLLR